jgi:hypothetical protein
VRLESIMGAANDKESMFGTMNIKHGLQEVGLKFGLELELELG